MDQWISAQIKLNPRISVGPCPKFLRASKVSWPGPSLSRAQVRPLSRRRCGVPIFAFNQDSYEEPKEEESDEENPDEKPEEKEPEEEYLKENPEDDPE